MKKRVLIECNKLLDDKNDGVKRYLDELIQQLIDNRHWYEDLLDVYIYRRGTIKALGPKCLLEEESIVDFFGYERRLVNFKIIVKKSLPNKVYKTFRNFYVKLSFRFLLFTLRLTVSHIRRWCDLLWFIVSNKKNPLDDFDLIHIPLPQNVRPFLDCKPNQNFIVTIHDVIHHIFPNYHTKANIANSKLGMDFITKRKADLITVSNNTKKDLAKYFGLNDGIRTIYLGVNKEKFYNDSSGFDEQKDKYGIVTNKYFITLFTIEPRKNLNNTIEAFIRLSESFPAYKLLVAGNIGWGINESSLIKHDKIIYTGYLSDSELRILFNNALCLLYLSLYEGFGLPLIEALYCDLPTLTSNNSSLQEIGRYTGRLTNPNKVEQITRDMSWFVLNPELRKQLIQSNSLNKHLFSWERMAKNTVQNYFDVLGINPELDN